MANSVPMSRTVATRVIATFAYSLKYMWTANTTMLNQWLTAHHRIGTAPQLSLIAAVQQRCETVYDGAHTRSV